MKKLLFLLLLLTTHILLSPNTAIAEKTMACETELAVGFAKVDGVWKPVKLDVPPFTIVISDDYKNIKMQRHEVGGRVKRRFICSPSSFSDKERLFCNEVLGDETFSLTKHNGRFVLTWIHSAGYAADQMGRDAIYGGICLRM